MFSAMWLLDPTAVAVDLGPAGADLPGHLLEVVAGGEHLAGAVEHDRPDLLHPLGRVERRPELALHRPVDRVPLVGTVEGDDERRPFHPREEALEGQPALAEAHVRRP